MVGAGSRSAEVHCEMSVAKKELNGRWNGYYTDIIKVFCRFSAANVDFSYFGKNSF